MGTELPNVLIDSFVIVAGLEYGRVGQHLRSQDNGLHTHEWRPDRSWSNSVAPDALVTDNLVAQSAHERDNRALGGGIVQ